MSQGSDLESTVANSNQDKAINSLDLAGFGKIAENIPEEVYIKTSETVLRTFEQLTAPITETTHGFGRYLRQKFDNMVEAEKAIATYTIDKAIARAKSKADGKLLSINPSLHPKTFVKSLEEASRETNALLHEMWVNLLSSQLTEDTCHPHFTEILPHFSPQEAKLLMALKSESEIGENGGGYIFFNYDSFSRFALKCGDAPKPWNISCTLLCEFRFADLLAPKDNNSLYQKRDTFIFRTKLGGKFLSVVDPERILERSV